jgi:hypothetical protein
MTGCRRLNIMEVQLAAGLSEVLRLPYVEAIHYYGWRPLRGNHSFIGPRYVDVARSPSDRSINILCSKLHAAFGMFLRTSAEWIVRTCDDVSVNAETFEHFMRELDDAGDPLTERIIQGHVIVKPVLSYVYPQGGSGVVFSRAAAEEIYTHKDAFLATCWQTWSDDRAIGRWMEAHSVTPWMATNRWFVGHQFFGVRSMEHIRYVHPCPASPGTAGGRRPYFQRVKDVTFWHNKENFGSFGRKVRRIREMLPDNLFFYPGVTNPVLCFGSNLTQSRYYDDSSFMLLGIGDL